MSAGPTTRPIVEQTGANLDEFRRGDPVITWGSADGKTWGSYAEFVGVSSRNVSPMPKSLNFAQAATESFEFGFSGLGPPGRASGPSPDRREFS